QIIPWNYPLLMAAWKLAPGLAAGNCCILKPAEATPLTAIKLFELIAEVGFPRGSAQLLLGPGPVVGHALAASPLVDKVAFTGGTATGRKIMEAATGNLKKLTLERVLAYIEAGRAEGAELLCGGRRLLDLPWRDGNFVAPTVFVKTNPQMRIVREEILGPVLSVQLFEDETEAVQLANDTIYGL